MAAQLQHWAGLIASGRADDFKETALLPDFLSDIFCGLLGYTGPAESPGPMKSPKAADECEPYLQEKRDDNARLTRALADAEAELNDRVYRLFSLIADEVKLLQKEVEH